jgi:hypothetical protein
MCSINVSRRGSDPGMGAGLGRRSKRSAYFKGEHTHLKLVIRWAYFVLHNQFCYLTVTTRKISKFIVITIATRLQNFQTAVEYAL